LGESLANTVELGFRTIVGAEILLLGELVVRVDGAPVEITARKQRCLLGVLALHAGTSMDADRLIDALWGEQPPATAAKNLQVLVGRVRAVLEPTRDAGTDWRVLRSSPGGYCLDPDACRIDVIEFDALVDQARRELVARAAGEIEAAQASATLRRAIELWRGRPLGELAYEAWAAPHVARLEEQHLAAVELEVEHQLGQGRHDQLVSRIEELVAEHPTRERLRAQQMLALYRAGRQADALEVYQQTRRVLDEELGIEPGRELRELQRSILEQDAALEVEPAPTGRTLPAPPTPRTSRVGRDREIQELTALLGRDDVRLVTATGWGGVGKTRLATETVHRLAGEFEGIAWIELASVADATLVPAALEAAFEAGGSDSDPIDAVARVIGEREILLVLDNYEHVLGAADVVPRLLQSCERLTVLATSRARLGVYGEHEYALEPFHVPSAADVAAGTDTFDSDALQLFMRRAEATGSKLELSAETAPAIARICASVDGLPLGIELAAARVKLLSPAEIVERLDRRLSLLTSGPGDLPDRQRSLRAAIEWSYDLLDESEQSLFRAMGVFVGGGTVEAIIAVAAPDRDEFEVLDQLESLVSKSLLARETTASGDVRLTMLESIAAFARELIAKDPDADGVRRRHATWYHAIAVAADTPKHTPETVVPRARLRADIPNVRAAFEWGLEHEPSIGAEIASGLAYHLMLSATSETAHEIVSAALQHETALSKRSVARLLTVAGDIAQRQGQPDAARSSRARALGLFNELGDSFGAAWVLHGMAEGAVGIDAYDEAREFLDRAEAVAADDQWARALIENQRLCIAGNLIQFDKVLEHLEKAHELFAREGDEFWMSHVNMNRGGILSELGNHEESVPHFEAAIEGFRRGHYWQMVPHAMSNLASALIGVGRNERAVATSAEAVQRARETGDRMLLSWAITVHALALLRANQLGQASTAAAEALGLAVEIGWYRHAWIPVFVLAKAAGNQDSIDVLRAWLVIDDYVLNPDAGTDRFAADETPVQLARITNALGAEVVRDTRSEFAELTLGERLDVVNGAWLAGRLRVAQDLFSPS
jgi:predicted ATPase/DNA-binding SARP family transcriptional activator